jgi:hypothetical protein
MACISSRLVLGGAAFQLAADPGSGIGLLTIRRSIDEPTALRTARSGAASHPVVSLIYVLESRCYAG